MAEIKSYIKEKEKRERKQTGYKEKIMRHKLAAFYRIALIIAALAALIVLLVVQYQQKVYTDYDIISSVPWENMSMAKNLRLGNNILTYSRDGAHCTDTKGSVKWNQTFEIQDAKVAVNGKTVAIGDYNGRSIYVANSEGILGEITTTMPIRDLTVSDSGYVTAVLADTDVTWINTYNSNGVLEKYGRAHMDDSGYPMSVSLSPNGELLCVSYMYVDAGVLKTQIVFYNFSKVGENVSDFMVSTDTYTDMLVPYVQFMDDETVFAVGDSMLKIYSGDIQPAIKAGYSYDREIRSVFYGNRYIGLVFRADDGENLYQLKVYDAKTKDASSAKPKDFYFNLDYTDIFFANDNIVIYNEKECLILTMSGREKFYGAFSKSVKLMLPVGSGYKYLLVTEDSIDTIQLK